jgi:hypothetical protein
MQRDGFLRLRVAEAERPRPTMLALLLYISLGPRTALAEIMVEFVIGAAVVGGGGGKRLKRSARLFLEQLRRRHAFAP